jgi:bacteriocin biosynthesis cyclodehydratase domain-containing protein
MDTPEASLPILRPDLAVIPMKDGVQLRAADEETWFVRTATPELALQLLTRLREPVTREALLAAAGPEHAAFIDSILDQLRSQNLLVQSSAVADDGEIPRYLMHFPQARGMAGLRSATVGILGDKSVTNLLARNLEEHGVRASAVTLGEKAEGDGRPGDVIVCAWTRPDLASVMEANAFACSRRLPCLFLDLSHGQHATLGPFYIPGEGACYACFRDRLRQNSLSPAELIAAEAHMLDHHSPLPAYGAMPTFRYLAVGLTGAEIVAFFTRHRPLRTLNRIVTIDLEKLETGSEPAWRIPWCAACSVEP